MAKKVKNLSTDSAEQVHQAFSRKKNSFLTSEKTASPRRLSAKKHHSIKPQGKAHSTKVKPLNAKASASPRLTMVAQAFQHTQKQSYPEFLLETTQALRTKAVKNLELKEQYIAKRRFKQMGAEMSRWISVQMQAKVSLLSEEKPQDWTKLMERQEERQFQINRVIPYLTD